MTELDTRTAVGAPQHLADDPHAGPVLLGIARAAIASRGSSGGIHPDDPAWLDEPGAAFVTITEDGSLRGCIGSIQPTRTLRDDIVHNACSAAFHDPRFPPLRAQDVPRVRLEVSVLSATSPLPASSRDILLERLRPHTDGLVLGWHGHRATFLPQVWEQLPEPRDFVDHLLRKAGLRSDFWAVDVVAHRFGVTAWAEPPDLLLTRLP
jgi:AmmeMemoRadiSam system protein A